MSLIWQLLAGVVGGNAGGYLAKARSMGGMMNSVLGAVGDLGSSALIGALLPLAASFFMKKKAD